MSSKLSALSNLNAAPKYIYGIDGSNNSGKINYNTINVKDFGATGDGVTDDSGFIQNAFDAAFGSVASPHGGTNQYLNKTVWFPSGNYRCVSTLNLAYITGGRIVGDGMLSSKLFYDGSIAGTATVTSLIYVNGWAYSRMEGLYLQIAGTNTCCLNLDWNNSGGGVSFPGHHAGRFSDMLLSGATNGCLVGLQGFQGSEYVWSDVLFSECTGAGLKTCNSNALNMTILGGGASECGVGYWAQQGSINFICNGSFANNTTADIVNGNACGMHLAGCRTESNNFLIDGNGANLVISGVQQNGNIATTTGNFVEQQSGGGIVIEGCRTDFGLLSGGAGCTISVRDSVFSALTYLDGYTGTAHISNVSSGTGNGCQRFAVSQKKSGSVLRTYCVEATALTDASFLYCSPSQDLNSISNASPAVFTTSFIHLLRANDPLVFTTTGTLPTGLSLATTYFVIAAGLASTTFRVSATQGGAAINTSSAGSGTHTYQMPRLYAVGDQILKTNTASGASPGWYVITAGYGPAIAAAGVKALANVA